MLTYAIGDIHGCLDLLVALLARIEADAAGRSYRLVCLGDYIDRGPDSAGVIAHLRGVQADRPDRVVCLKGNHEDLMLGASRHPTASETWLWNGGETTLDSFGAGSIEAVAEDVLSWIAALPTWFEDDARIFVHAGLRPGRPVADQSDHDRLWIRDEFLVGDHDFGKFVVHGHTPQLRGRPELRRLRVNLDTGAVYGGQLTAGIFSDLQAGPTGFLHIAA